MCYNDHIHHYRQNNIPLNDDSVDVIKHLRTLWGFDVYLHSLDEQGKVSKSYSCSQSHKSEGSQLELNEH